MYIYLVYIHLGKLEEFTNLNLAAIISGVIPRIHSPSSMGFGRDVRS